MAASNGNAEDAACGYGGNSRFDETQAAPSYAHASRASIKDYSLQAFLGEGSTAHVYLATRVDTHEVVAIKVIDKLLVRQAQMEHKVHREKLLHSPLRHQHVVRVYDAFEDARNHYLVLEHCEGGSMASLLRSLREEQEGMDEAMAKNLFRQTAHGVAYLHGQGIIHRDLKLSNLLLTEDDVVKISDFGLATRISDEHVTVCGTPNFIAPEVLSATSDAPPYDETVDIWSLGCILYTLLLGTPPFEGSRVSDTLTNVSNAGLEPLRFPNGFSATIGDLIKRMLSREAKSRPTIDQVLAHPWLRSSTPTSANQRQLLEASTHTLFRMLRPIRPIVRSREKPPASLRQPSTGPRKSTSRNDVYYGSDESSSSEEEYGSDFDLDGLSLASEASDDSEDNVLPTEMGRRRSNELPMSATVHVEKSAPSIKQVVCKENNAANADEDHAVADAQWDTPPRNPRSAVAAEVHFMRLYVEVSDLPFLGLSADEIQQIVWDSWETSDIRQLARFTLQIGDVEAEYTPSKSLIQGIYHNGSSFRYLCSPDGASKHREISTNDDLYRIVRLCQCLASRTLQLRSAAMAVDVEDLPMIHYDRFPQSILDSLRRDSVQASLTYQLGGSTLSVPQSDSSVRCVLPGVGTGEFDANGQLVIHFFSGPVLKMSASGSTIRYSRSPNGMDDEFDLSASPYLPSEVKKHFQHVPAFIRQLKSP